MSEPRRVQRSRAKGWRMPPGTVYVGRPSKWGNPFRLDSWQGAFQALQLGERGDRAGRRAAAVKIYRLWLTARKRVVDRAKAEKDAPFAVALAHNVSEKPPRAREIRAALRGKTLACWCPLDQPCHADVLLEIANA